MIYVIADLDCVPGARARVLAAFEAIVEQVRAERGCIEYVPTVDLDTGLASQHPARPDRVTVIEQWESAEALRAHDQAPHMREFRAQVRNLVQGREIRMLGAA